jgi:hypothetical protein
MNRLEYWFLDSVIDELIVMSWVVSEEDAMDLNRRHHGLEIIMVLKSKI